MSTFDRIKFLLDGVDAELDQARQDVTAEQNAHGVTREDLRVALEKVAACEANHNAPAPPTIRDLVGVRIFPQYATKTYGRHDALFSWLADSSLTRVTGLLDHDTSADVLAFYQRLHTELGMKFWFTVGKPRVLYTAAQWDAFKAILDGPLAGAVEQVANWNEPNHRRTTNDPVLTDWEIHAGTQQAGLWDAAQPRGIDVCTPQLWSGNLTEHEADLRKMAPHIAGKFNRIAWHLYPRGGVGADLVEQFYDLYHSVLGVHPVSVTEAGYFDAPNYTGGAIRVSPDEAGEYIGPHIKLYTDRGDRFGGFEFLDDPDSAGTNREASLGWIDTPQLDPATWAAKPIYHAVKALIST